MDNRYCPFLYYKMSTITFVVMFNYLSLMICFGDLLPYTSTLSCMDTKLFFLAIRLKKKKKKNCGLITKLTILKIYHFVLDLYVSLSSSIQILFFSFFFSQTSYSTKIMQWKKKKNQIAAHWISNMWIENTKNQL